MDDRTDRRTYYTATQGIWPRGLHSQALRAITGFAFIINKKINRWPYSETISLTGPHRGPPDPSVGINTSWWWTPTLEVNTNTKIAKITLDSQTDGQTDGYIILSLGGFKYVPYVHIFMRVIMGRAFIISKNRCRQRDIQTYRHISSTGPHWGTLDPSVGINASRRWTPTLGINKKYQNCKMPVDDRTGGHTDGWTYCNSTQGGWTRGLRPHGLRTIMGSANDRPKSTRTIRQTERHKDI